MTRGITSSESWHVEVGRNSGAQPPCAQDPRHPRAEVPRL